MPPTKECEPARDRSIPPAAAEVRAAELIPMSPDIAGAGPGAPAAAAAAAEAAEAADGRKPFICIIIQNWSPLHGAPVGDSSGANSGPACDMPRSTSAGVGLEGLDGLGLGGAGPCAAGLAAASSDGEVCTGDVPATPGAESMREPPAGGGADGKANGNEAVVGDIMRE